MSDTDDRLERLERVERRTGERLERLEQRVAGIATAIGYLATKADIEGVKTLIAEREATMLRWLIGMVATSALAVAIALVRTFMG